MPRDPAVRDHVGTTLGELALRSALVAAHRLGERVLTWARANGARS